MANALEMMMNRMGAGKNRVENALQYQLNPGEPEPTDPILRKKLGLPPLPAPAMPAQPETQITPDQERFMRELNRKYRR